MMATVSFAFLGLFIVLWSGTSNAQSSCSSYTTLHASTYDNQTVTSPNYPSNYPRSQRCNWIITAIYPNVIKVVFDEFKLQSSYQCYRDYLEFYDGGSEFSSEIGKFCGTSHPDVVYSSGTSLYVKFKSYTFQSFLNLRFSFKLSAVPRDEAAGICSPSKSDSSNSNLKVVASSGTIFTPNYPVDFKDEMECIWTINVPAQKRVKLTFEAFDLSSSDVSCTTGNAYVEVRDGSYSYSNVLGTYCGSSIPPVVESTGYKNNLRVKFYAGYSVASRPGFKARFEAIEADETVDEKCFPGNPNNNNLKLSGSSGTFHSPLHPANYPPDMTCTWIITVPDGKAIKLTFNTFDVEYESGCYDDYVEVRDGEYSTSDRIGKYCGYSPPDSITSNGRYLRVRFVSDAGEYQIDNGFEAEFRAVDKSNIGLIVGIIVAIAVFCVIIVCAVCIVKKNWKTGARQAVPQTNMTTAPQSTPMTTIQYPPPPMAPYGQPYPPPAGSPYPPPSVGYAPYPTHPPPAYPDVAPPPYPEPAGVPQYPPPGQSYPWAQDPKNTPQPSAPPIGP